MKKLKLIEFKVADSNGFDCSLNCPSLYLTDKTSRWKCRVHDVRLNNLPERNPVRCTQCLDTTLPVGTHVIHPGKVYWVGRFGVEFFAIRDEIVVGSVLGVGSHLKAWAMCEPIISPEGEYFTSLELAKEAVEKELEKLLKS